MRELIVERLARGEDLGLQLTTYAEEIHAGYRAPPIAPETDTILRAIVLASLVDRVCSRFSLTPTLRSYNPKRPLPSGCHVVALALIVESPVEERREEALAAIEAERSAPGSDTETDRSCAPIHFSIRPRPRPFRMPRAASWLIVWPFARMAPAISGVR